MLPSHGPGKSRRGVAPGPSDHDLLFIYAEKFFKDHSRERFPTVRQAAKDLKWTQSRVEEAVEGDPDSRTFLTSYNCEVPEPKGNHFVETYTYLSEESFPEDLEAVSPPPEGVPSKKLTWKERKALRKTRLSRARASLITPEEAIAMNDEYAVRKVMES